MSKYTITVEVMTDEDPLKWDLSEILDGVITWSVEEKEE